MANRYQGGFLAAGLNPLKAPNAPTIGTATVASATSASVAFTAPTCVGGSAITSYAVRANCGIGASGSSSPITVSGLTTGTAYTFTVSATNSYGPSPASAASNSVTPAQVVGQQAYTTAGTYSWVAPAGVTSVSAVAVGGGGGGRGSISAVVWGGTGGSLAYRNNISVTPGNSYTVVVGDSGGAGASGGGSGGSGGISWFSNQCTILQAPGGNSGQSRNGTLVGGGGGYGGLGGCGGTRVANGGGGAGGYSGDGGYGGTEGATTGGSGSGGGGGGGGRGYACGSYCCCTASGCGFYSAGGSGGGVGIYGAGSNGAGGSSFGGDGTAGSGGSGGTYGGAGGGGGATYTIINNKIRFTSQAGRAGAGGAVRIIWPGTTRSFPSTCTGNL